MKTFKSKVKHKAEVILLIVFIAVLLPTSLLTFSFHQNNSSTTKSLGIKASNSWATTTKYVGTHPQEVCIGDVNNDGYNDTVIANYGSSYWGGSVSILTWDEAEGGWDSTSKSFGYGLRGLALGDANNDEYTDIVAVNEFDDIVSILCWNEAEGGWDRTTKSVGGSPRGVGIGDANNDGYRDIVTANYDSDTVGILCWNSSTTDWNAPIIKSVGNGPLDVEIGDTTNNGQNEIVVPNFSADTVSILCWNESKGNWNDQLTESVGAEPYAVSIGDANNDGQNDIVTPNREFGAVSIVCWNETLGDWEPQIRKAIGTYASFSTGVSIGDLNNDGQNDIVATNKEDDTISILYWNSSKNSWEGDITKSVGTGPISVSTGDANNDGLNDIAVVNEDGGTVSILCQEDLTAPEWEQEPTNQTIEIGTTFSYDVNATDSTEVKYSLNNTDNFTIDSETGIISNTTTLEIGEYVIEIIAEDSSGNVRSTNITITVEETGDDTLPSSEDPSISGFKPIIMLTIITSTIFALVCYRKEGG